MFKKIRTSNGASSFILQGSLVLSEEQSSTINHSKSVKVCAFKLKYSLLMNLSLLKHEVKTVNLYFEIIYFYEKTYKNLKYLDNINIFINLQTAIISVNLSDSLKKDKVFGKTESKLWLC